MKEELLRIPPIDADPISVFFSEREEEAQQYHRQHQQVEEKWKAIITDPHFVSAQFEGNWNQSIIIHRSPRRDVDWQVSFFDRYGIPCMHENYFNEENYNSYKDYRYKGYSLDELFNRLAFYSLGGRTIEVKIMMDDEPEVKPVLDSVISASSSEAQCRMNSKNNNFVQGFLEGDSEKER